MIIQSSCFPGPLDTVSGTACHWPVMSLSDSPDVPATGDDDLPDQLIDELRNTIDELRMMNARLEMMMRRLWMIVLPDC